MHRTKRSQRTAKSCASITAASSESESEIGVGGILQKCVAELAAEHDQDLIPNTEESAEAKLPIDNRPSFCDYPFALKECASPIVKGECTWRDSSLLHR